MYASSRARYTPCWTLRPEPSNRQSDFFKKLRMRAWKFCREQRMSVAAPFCGRAKVVSSCSRRERVPHQRSTWRPSICISGRQRMAKTHPLRLDSYHCWRFPTWAKSVAAFVPRSIYPGLIFQAMPIYERRGCGSSSRDMRTDSREEAEGQRRLRHKHLVLRANWWWGNSVSTRRKNSSI